jgi:uncharacterized membrane protein YkvA (DUF1232 family)
MKKTIQKYRNRFSEIKMWQKLKNSAKQAGLKSVYTILLLYYAYKRSETPSWAKNIIIGVIGYFIAPIDAIPDLTPFFGYTDDIGILSFGLVTIACYVNEDVKENARQKLHKWFGDYDEDELREVDAQL